MNTRLPWRILLSIQSSPSGFDTHTLLVRAWLYSLRVLLLLLPTLLTTTAIKSDGIPDASPSALDPS